MWSFLATFGGLYGESQEQSFSLIQQHTLRVRIDRSDGLKFGESPQVFCGENIRQWDLILSKVEFTYNRSTSQYIVHSSFERVYEENSLITLELAPTLLVIEPTINAKAGVKEIQSLHEYVKEKIVK